MTDAVAQIWKGRYYWHWYIANVPCDVEGCRVTQQEALNAACAHIAAHHAEVKP